MENALLTILNATTTKESSSDAPANTTKPAREATPTDV
jgi:hypothetical protein